MSSFIFNGRSSTEFPYLKIRKINSSLLPPLEQRYHKIPGRPGVFHFGTDVNARVDTIEITILGYTREELAKQKRELAGWLFTETPKPLIYSYEPDKQYMALIDQDTDLDEIMGIGRTTLTFFIPDPIAESVTETTQTIAGIPTILNDTDTTDEWNQGTLDKLAAADNSLTLAKIGSDYKYVVDTDWNTQGTLNNVVDQNGILQLLKSGTDLVRYERYAKDFLGTHSNTKLVALNEIVEDFEDTSYEWSFTTPAGSTVGWERVVDNSFSGEACFASVAMTPTAQTRKYARTEFTVATPTGSISPVLSIMYQVSSEAGYDLFRIYVNGTLQLTDSGLQPWKKFSYNLTAGATYTIRLEYEIDGATSGGKNRAYVDDIRLTYIGPDRDVKVVVANVPTQDFRDDMKFYHHAWDELGAGSITQLSDRITITSSATTATGVNKPDCVTFPFTLDFYCKSDGVSAFYISNGVKLFNDIIPATGGQFKWVRVRCVDSTTAHVYMDGSLVKTITSSDYTVNRVILFYSSANATIRSNELSAVYFTYADLGAQVTSYAGSYLSQEYDIDKVGIVNSSLADWIAAATSPYTGVVQSLTVQFRQVDYSSGSPIYGQWTDGIDESPVPILSVGENTANQKIQYQVVLGSTDPGFSPYLDDITLEVLSGYYASGYMESHPIAEVSRVIKSLTSWVNWVIHNQPAGTNIQVSVSWALDGINFGEWLLATAGGSIPGIDTTSDLSQAALKYKIELSTSDLSITPSIDNLEFNLNTATHTLGERISLEIPLSELELIGESTLITWDVTPDASPDVQVYVQIVNSGMQPTTEGWVAASNGSPIPGLTEGTNVVGKSLYTRQTLAGDGSNSPTLHRLLVEIHGPGGNTITYTGTERTYPYLTVTFTKDISTFDLLHFESGNRIYMPRGFVIGDVLAIDNKLGKVTVNGELAMGYFSIINSDWLYLQPGVNTFITTPDDACTVDLVWRDRFK